MRTTTLLAATALLSIASAADAHRLWLEPSQTIVSGQDSWVTFDAAESTDVFVPDHRALRIEQIKVTQPDGGAGQAQNAMAGKYRLTFDVQIDKPGTWKIAMASSNVMGSFKLNGEERRVGGRFGPPPGGAPGLPGGPGFQRPPPIAVKDIPAEATDVKLTEVSMRNEVFVTSGAPTRTVITPTGKGLELDPLTHPDELISNEPARFRFMIDGKPAPGLKLTLVSGGRRYRDSDNALQVTTGADGVATIKWPAAGLYWLNATTTDNHPSEPRATERRMSYTATVEVLAP
ncbi:DUF4198 domain-containing protein [Sphingomonas bacterium]|uniref:DUF4198 domain-containing protein n=1 Tax=Sphingomonas bacterium TaxID=1895847 RepID=UPI001574F5EF|nr:DUF4198 domain-containing protein [Sphingomonas bacterium]